MVIVLEDVCTRMPVKALVAGVELPEIDMTRSFRRDDVYTKLCGVMPPTIIDRDSSAFVNFESADRYLLIFTCNFEYACCGRFCPAHP